jgi:serine phosphatase RsbU (regulator of sigma subunit)
MSMLRTALHMLAHSNPEVASVLVQASRTLRGAMRPGMFLTCVYGILDTERHLFRYVCAGHCPPILLGSRTPRLLDAGGKPIGMFPDAVFERSLRTHEVRIEPGTGLLLYSDGLTEALDPSGQPLVSRASCCGWAPSPPQRQRRPSAFCWTWSIAIGSSGPTATI